jgi:hypothetical protein
MMQYSLPTSASPWIAKGLSLVTIWVIYFPSSIEFTETLFCYTAINLFRLLYVDSLTFF